MLDLGLKTKIFGLKAKALFPCYAIALVTALILYFFNIYR